MRCPTCDMEITASQKIGKCCVFCEQIVRAKFDKSIITKAGVRSEPAPVTEPEIVEYEPEPTPEPVPEPVIEPEDDEPEIDFEMDDSGSDSDIPQSMSSLREMSKSELIELARDLELDSDGYKYELVDRIAEELGL